MSFVRSIIAAAWILPLAACTTEEGGIRSVFSPSSETYVAEENLDVPYVPTPRPVVDRMMQLAEVGPDDYLIDLGSGDGRIALAAAERGARALGVDIDPYRVNEATAAAQFAGLQTRALFRRQDLFDTPLRDATVVAMYLLPHINLRLRPRLLTELRPGTRVLSHVFDMGAWRPDVAEQLNGSNIFMWIVPAAVGGTWTMTLLDGSAAPLEIEQTFQQVAGTLGGRQIADAALRGTSLRFTVGGQTFHGVVDGADIRPDPAAPTGAATGWRARRVS
jgi:SAM-dependent methyltransferase